MYKSLFKLLLAYLDTLGQTSTGLEMMQQNILHTFYHTHR